MQRKSKHFFLIFLATPKKGSFLYRLHYVRQASTVKFWKGLILTKPFGFDTMNSRGRPESEKRKEQTNEASQKMRKNEGHKFLHTQFYDRRPEA